MKFRLQEFRFHLPLVHAVHRPVDSPADHGPDAQTHFQPRLQLDQPRIVEFHVQLAQPALRQVHTLDFFNADDEFILRQDYAALGYQFELGEGWHLVPKAGRAKWKLTSEKGWLLHDDDVETELRRGYEYFWELGFGKRVNEVMSLGASVRSGSYGFGDATSVAFVMTFAF
ncbi:MAG: hypothetical protein ACREXP_31670 [Steroidobacteraceae bacterium]